MRALAFVLIVSATACTFGPGRHDFPPIATSPHGALGSIRMTDADTVIPIELIEVRDSALLVLTANRYALAMFSDIRTLDLPPHVSDVRRFDDDVRALERLRPLSRFPHGIPTDVMDELMRASGQAALLVLRRDGS